VSTWVHAWAVLHNISKSSLLHVRHGNNVGHPLYPWTAGQTHTLTYIMSSRSTSLEPKSQLTVNLDPRWECQSLPSEENKEKKVPDQRSEESKRRKFPIKIGRKQKKRNKNSRSKVGRKQNTERCLDQAISEQYRIVTSKQVNKKRKETTTQSGPLPLIANKNPLG